MRRLVWRVRDSSHVRTTCMHQRPPYLYAPLSLEVKQQPNHSPRELCVYVQRSTQPLVCEKPAMNAFAVTQSPLPPFFYAATVAEIKRSVIFQRTLDQRINVPLLSLDKREARTLADMLGVLFAQRNLLFCDKAFVLSRAHSHFCQVPV